MLLFLRMSCFPSSHTCSKGFSGSFDAHIVCYLSRSHLIWVLPVYIRKTSNRVENATAEQLGQVRFDGKNTRLRGEVDACPGK